MQQLEYKKTIKDGKTLKYHFLQDLPGLMREAFPLQNWNDYLIEEAQVEIAHESQQEFHQWVIVTLLRCKIESLIIGNRLITVGFSRKDKPDYRTFEFDHLADGIMEHNHAGRTEFIHVYDHPANNYLCVRKIVPAEH
jgi:CHASE2 domain-containing sensor protein